jgi:hypothetical protein
MRFHEDMIPNSSLDPATALFRIHIEIFSSEETVTVEVARSTLVVPVPATIDITPD